MTIQVVDYVTGKPISNATVVVSRIWTGFPVEKIPVLGIKPWSRETILAQAGIVRISGVPRPPYRIVVEAKGYAKALIEQRPRDESDNLDVYRIVYHGDQWLHESPYEYVNRKRPFTVALEPYAGGTNRAGARYLGTPSAGSKEKAIMTAKRQVKKWPGEFEIKEAAFRNGHWEVTLSRVPAGPGSITLIDVGDDGEILGIRGTY